MNRKIVLLLLVLITILSLYSKDDQEIERTSLRNFSQSSCIPVRKLIEYLELPQDTNIDKTLQELNCSSEEVTKAVNRFHDNRHRYHIGIVVVGMGTVFASLILVALLIGQLRHLDKKKIKSNPQIPVYSKAGLNTSEEDDIVAAIVSTIYLYELEIEENNRLMLTWKRTPLSMWKASRFIPMNEVDPSRRS